MPALLAVFVPSTDVKSGRLDSTPGGPSSSSMTQSRLHFSLFLSAVALWGQTPLVQLTPAQRRIDKARADVAKTPNRYQAYNALALALLQRERESGDSAYFDQAQAAATKSLALEKDNYDAQKAQAGILIGRHEFTLAKELGKKINKRNMDDLESYALIVDSAIELGDYKEAEEAAQWMLDLRPADPRALERGARLRELFGNPDGAMQLWISAFRQTPESETETRAWILVNSARTQMATGKLDAADKAVQDAFLVFPAYHLATMALADLRMAQKRYSEAADLLNAVPHLTLEGKYTLAEALDKAGRSEAASKAYADFEKQANAAVSKPDNANRQLVFYYANHAAKPAEALRVARAEAARRHDVFTMDALAWALHVNKDDAEARKEMDRVLAVGIRDSRIRSTELAR